MLAERDPEEARADSRPRPRIDDGGRPPLRGHREPGDGRRHHGAVRGAAGLRGSRRPRLLRRAAHAGSLVADAAAIRDSHGISIRIRVGLNSGEVVVRRSATTSGWTTRRWARPHTWPRAWSRWPSRGPSWRPRTPSGWSRATSRRRRTVGALRGLEAALEVYTMTGSGRVRSSLAAAVSRGLTRFVGREAELAQLDAARESAGSGSRSGRGARGRAGCRQVAALPRVRAAGAHAGLDRGQGSSVSYGKTTAYGPVIDLLRAYFGVDDRDDPQAFAGRSPPELLRTGDEPDSAGRRPSCRCSMSRWRIPGGPRSIRGNAGQETMARYSGWCCAAARCDRSASCSKICTGSIPRPRSVLDSLVESLPEARILLLVNYRPEYGTRGGASRPTASFASIRWRGAVPRRFSDVLLGS